MIDWAWVGGLEGRSLAGYVPDSGRSGVTIATGCDLAWLTDTELLQMPNLCGTRFRPYRGLTGVTARNFVGAHPITISEADADGVDQVTFAADVATISTAFARDSHTAFSTLPNRAQTVLASVAFQYGNLARKCPHFWAVCVARDYAGMVRVLRDFGDEYSTRRNKEADYLEPDLKETNQRAADVSQV